MMREHESHIQMARSRFAQSKKASNTPRENHVHQVMAEQLAEREGRKEENRNKPPPFAAVGETELFNAYMRGQVKKLRFNLEPPTLSKSISQLIQEADESLIVSKEGYLFCNEEDHEETGEYICQVYQEEAERLAKSLGHKSIGNPFNYDDTPELHEWFNEGKAHFNRVIKHGMNTPLFEGRIAKNERAILFPVHNQNGHEGQYITTLDNEKPLNGLWYSRIPKDLDNIVFVDHPLDAFHHHLKERPQNTAYFAPGMMLNDNTRDLVCRVIDKYKSANVVTPSFMDNDFFNLVKKSGREALLSVNELSHSTTLSRSLI